MSHRFNTGSLSLLLSAGFMVPIMGWVAVAAADHGPSEKEEEPAPRHRISFGAQWFGASEGNSITGPLTYSWVPLEHHGFAATVPLVRSDVTGAEGSGIGDTRLQYSYVPSAKITAAAWVPTTHGVGFGLIVPSGDPARGTGFDRWVAIPTPGWVFTFGQQFTRVFGGTVTLGSVERPPIQNPDDARSSDEFVELTQHLVLPR